MDVAVLIVSYRGELDVQRCLAALAASRHTEFRVVICENGGAEAFARLTDSLPARLPGGQPVELHMAPGNLGFAGGVNLCLDLAGEAGAYWILNPDTEPAPDALGAMVDRLAHGDCTAVGHDIVLPDGRTASRGGGRWLPWTARAVSLGHGEPWAPAANPEAIERQMSYLIGASMLISAGFLQRVGRMREDYFLYCEEVEWFLRAVSAGERLGYAPVARVVHSHGASTGGGGPMRTRSRISVYLVERNRLLVNRDLFPHLFAISAAFAMFHVVFRYGKTGALAQIAYALAGWWGGVRNERGRPAWF